VAATGPRPAPAGAAADQQHRPSGAVALWSIWAPPLQLAIAPARRPGPIALQAAGRQGQRRSGLQAGGSDQFRELTPLRPEEGLHRAAWKTAAKGQGLQAKRFDTEEASECWLPPAEGLPLERALEHVCESFCQAIGQGDAVGLALPGGISLAPGSGRQQLQRGLQALAAVAPTSPL
jgi:uncharacterized protein (DUF58 family)